MSTDLQTRLRASFFEALTGAGGVVVSAYIVFPIDFIKTRMQIPNSPYQYSSLIDGIRQTVQNEGFLTLYTGVESELIKGSIQNFLYLFAYDLLKSYAIHQPMFLSNQSTNQSINQKVSHQRPLINQSTHCHCHGSNTVGIRYAFRKEKRSKRKESIYQSIDQSVESIDQSSSQSTDDESTVPSTNPSDSDDDEYDLVEAKRQIVKVLPISQSLNESIDASLQSITAVNQSINQSIAVPPPQLSIASNLFIGMLAGCFTQLFVNPLSVIQTRIMTTQRQSISQSINTSMPSIARSIYEKEGFSAFYTGLIPSFILTSNPAIQYLVFDRLKRLIDRLLIARLIDRPISALESFVIGAIAKITATLATYPYIMAKLRMQYKPNVSVNQSINQTNNQSINQSRGTIATIYHIIQSEGFTGLYTGLKAQLLKSVLGAALMFMFKEKLAQLITYLMKSISQSKKITNGKASKSEANDQSINHSINQSKADDQEIETEEVIVDEQLQKTE